jgi:outer membrane murein-binding lipoprotein Lpp
MKTRSFIKIAVVCASIFFASCSRDKKNADGISSPDAITNTKLDQISNDVEDVVESQYFAQNPSATGKLSDIAALLPACATTSVEIIGTTWTRTVDFGTIGCAMPNGNVLKGKIIASGSTIFTNTNYVITYTFENFYHNNALIQGTRTVTRSVMGTASNTNPHPVYVMDINMSVTFSNLGTYTRVGTRTRELIEGYTTSALLDNIYVVTGSWTTTKPDGNAHTVTIVNPLRFDIAGCPSYKLVSGSFHIIKNSHYADIDYGTGSCDNNYTVSIDGGTPVAHTF